MKDLHTRKKKLSYNQSSFAYMKPLFITFVLCISTLSLSAVQGWMWLNQFPWVYSHEDENWLYFTPNVEVLIYKNQKWNKTNSLSASSMGWLWFDLYPLIYSHNQKAWLQFKTLGDEPLYAYGAWNNEWSELGHYKHNWDKQYSKWILNPDRYGGLGRLKKIKEAKINNVKELTLWSNGISDISPLSGLTKLKV